MKLNHLSFLLFSLLFFCSFSSEKNTAILKTKVSTQKKHLNLPKKQKSSFKERMAIKILEKKIRNIKKRQSKKQSQSINSQKNQGEIVIFLIAILIVILVLTGLVGGILLLIAGETLFGILSILIGVIVIPLLVLMYLENNISFVGR